MVMHSEILCHKAAVFIHSFQTSPSLELVSNIDLRSPQYILKAYL